MTAPVETMHPARRRTHAGWPAMLGRAADSTHDNAMESISVECPAKTNLTLSVGSRNDAWGGRHALDTIYCALGLYDTVSVTTKHSGSGFSLQIEGEHLGDLAGSNSDMLRNHAVLALLALSRACRRQPDVAIRIVKRIPVGAGLGGGSADAAGTLLALNSLWNLHWDMERLRELGADLGADVPFCLMGGYARGTGYGERIDTLDPHGERIARLYEEGFTQRMLVGAYHTQLSTPTVYSAFDRLGAGTTTDAGSNDLQRAAISLHPRSGTAIRTACEAGATRSFISGSGPSVIACVRDDRAEAAVRHAWIRSMAVDRIISACAPATPIMHAFPRVTQ